MHALVWGFLVAQQGTRPRAVYRWPGQPWNEPNDLLYLVGSSLHQPKDISRRPDLRRDLTRRRCRRLASPVTARNRQTDVPFFELTAP